MPFALVPFISRGFACDQTAPERRSVPRGVQHNGHHITSLLEPGTFTTDDRQVALHACHIALIVHITDVMRQLLSNYPVSAHRISAAGRCETFSFPPRCPSRRLLFAPNPTFIPPHPQYVDEIHHRSRPLISRRYPGYPTSLSP